MKQTDATQKKGSGPIHHASGSDSSSRRTRVTHLTYKQPTATLTDYSVQPLLPYMLSSHGPPLAVGDVNGDGLDDVFIGGAAGEPGQLFIQRKDGSFVASTQGQPWEADKAYEDWGAVFFDANGDGLPDLYVTSGGYQLAPSISAAAGSPLHQQGRRQVRQRHVRRCQPCSRASRSCASGISTAMVGPICSSAAD